MKLFNLRLTTLKSKLYAIVFASFVVRVVAFFMLPNTASSLGPDEGTYGSVAGWTALGKSAAEFPNYGAGLYASGRSLFLPAAFFTKIGFTPLDSVRLTASLYALLTTLLVVVILQKTASKFLGVAKFIQERYWTFLSLFLIFSFLPSHFLWSVLGLRESATEFWAISVFTYLYLILQLNGRATLWATCGFLISIIMVFSARPQVGWVVGITLLIYLFTKIRDRATRILIPLTAIGIFLGNLGTVASTIEFSSTFTARQIIPTPAPTKSEETASKTPAPTKSEEAASKICEVDQSVIELDGALYRCTEILKKEKSIELKNPGVVVIDRVKVIPYYHEVNKLSAESIIKTQSCPIMRDPRFDKYFCIAYAAPYTTYTFLFRPLLGADVTSNSSLFAAVENIFWLSAFLFVVVMFIRNRRLAFFGALAPSLLFFSIYSVAAGAYEGNMGTAFRHKSFILWVVLLLIASTIVATQQRKAEQQGIFASSQE
jgi:hypothetical protein